MTSTLHDLCLDMGNLSDLALRLRTWNAAVQSEPGSHEVEAVVAAKVDTGGIREAVALGRHGCDDVTEALQLLRVQFAFLVGAGEMAVQGLDREPVERRDLVRPKPEAIHPCVDHHVARPIGRDILPPSNLFDRVEHRARIQLQRSFDIGRTDAVKDGKTRPFRNLPKLLRFRPDGDEEVPAAGAVQRVHGLPGAETIGIGLDRGAGRHACTLRKSSPVVN